MHTQTTIATPLKLFKCKICNKLLQQKIRKGFLYPHSIERKPLKTVIFKMFDSFFFERV